MYIILFQVTIAIFLGVIFSALISLLSKKSLFSDAFTSPFECGFVPFKNRRGSYSLQFFLIALIFLVFDIEIIILFPVLLAEINLIPNIFLGFLIFMLILFLGLFVEWSQTRLE